MSWSVLDLSIFTYVDDDSSAPELKDRGMLPRLRQTRPEPRLKISPICAALLKGESHHKLMKFAMKTCLFESGGYLDVVFVESRGL